MDSEPKPQGIPLDCPIFTPPYKIKIFERELSLPKKAPVKLMLQLSRYEIKIIPSDPKVKYFQGNLCYFLALHNPFNILAFIFFLN